MAQYVEVARKIIEEVKKAVIGKDECVKKILAAILAGGHILIEDIPGVGKTTMAVAFAKSMTLIQNGCSSHRMYFRRISQDFPCMIRKAENSIMNRGR